MKTQHGTFTAAILDALADGEWHSAADLREELGAWNVDHLSQHMRALAKQGRVERGLAEDDRRGQYRLKPKRLLKLAVCETCGQEVKHG